MPVFSTRNVRPFSAKRSCLPPGLGSPCRSTVQTCTSRGRTLGTCCSASLCGRTANRSAQGASTPVSGKAVVSVCVFFIEILADTSLCRLVATPVFAFLIWLRSGWLCAVAAFKLPTAFSNLTSLWVSGTVGTTCPAVAEWVRRRSAFLAEAGVGARQLAPPRVRSNAFARYTDRG